ncbi:ABC transporter permease subunit [Streptomyces sp. MP131-18]|uniref:ABC transporter permease n=1 Tax=Streptomyces sp. MP131-18 TaxID=1857892 RepID=UPI0009D2104C|nr:putative multiple-sugar transport system permease YteP [Streptomyces sp. MP131-18]
MTNTLSRTRSTGAPPGRRPPGERPRSPWRARLRGQRTLLLLAAPGIVYFLVFHYAALFGNVIAFKDYVPFQGVWESPWVGFDNFERMFQDQAFWQAAWNTVAIAGLQIVFFFPLPLALALLLHSLARGRIRALVQSVVYLPHFLSWVIVVALFQQMLGPTGMFGGDVAFVADVLSNPDAFKPLMVAQIIWKDCGWGTIIFLAALSQVNNDLYESAALDGAGPWRRFWHITLPALRPIIILLLIMRLGDILTVGFEQILLQRDAVGPEAGEVLDTFVYFHGVLGADWGYSAAAGLFKGLVGAVLVFAANRIAHRLGEQGVYK